MARYEIRDENDAVVNVIEWDGVSDYDPGEGLTLHLIEEPDAQTSGPDLPTAKDAAKLAIADACEAARLRVAPYINYMDTEYQVLAAQADAYVLAGSPENPVGLDMLVQSAEDSGRTVAQEAALVQTRRDAYIALLNATRSLRRQGQAAIDAATDVETIHSLRDQYVGQLASL